MICSDCGCKIEEFKDYWRNEDNLPFCNKKCLEEFEKREE